MEYEKSTTQTTLKEVLGAKNQSEQEIGLISETEGFIYRRAYDYLMVGFVTDVDQIEEQKESRFEAYIDKIDEDFVDYLVEALRWDKKLKLNADPKTWQTNLYDNRRRFDLPTVEMCEKAQIGAKELPIPSRDQIRSVAQEGIEKYFDQALNDSYELLKQQQADILNELPIAPYEEYEPGVRTHQQLVDEYTRNVSRMSAIEEIYTARNPMDAADNIAYLQSELSGQTPPITEKIYIVRSLGKTTANLVRTA